MASCLSLSAYFRRFGGPVSSNLEPIRIGNYIFTKEVQAHALITGKIERIVIAGALRGIFLSMNEGLHNDFDFCGQVTAILKDNFESFADLIRLLRNVYSHEITWASRGDLILKRKDFERYISYRINHGKPMCISFGIAYADVMPNVPTPKDYGIHLQVSLEDLQEGEKTYLRLSVLMISFCLRSCVSICARCCCRITTSLKLGYLSTSIHGAPLLVYLTWDVTDVHSRPYKCFHPYPQAAA